MPRLLAVCVVHQLRLDAGAEGVTGIDKRPLTGAVRVNHYGLRGDVQVSRRHHGGLDKALYAYAEHDADHWAQQLGRPLPPGWFGENLRIADLDINGALIGERWLVGERVEVEVTMARTPCMTFARWVGGADKAGWVKRFAHERRPGAYLRVVRGGEIAAGDEVRISHRPDGAPRLLDGLLGIR